MRSRAVTKGPCLLRRSFPGCLNRPQVIGSRKDRLRLRRPGKWKEPSSMRPALSSACASCCSPKDKKPNDKRNESSNRAALRPAATAIFQAARQPLRHRAHGPNAQNLGRPAAAQQNTLATADRLASVSAGNPVILQPAPDARPPPDLLCIDQSQKTAHCRPARARIKPIYNVHGTTHDPLLLPDTVSPKASIAIVTSAAAVLHEVVAACNRQSSSIRTPHAALTNALSHLRLAAPSLPACLPASLPATKATRRARELA
ncbi:hypothetical protein F503_00143 [Ophiostoma piceae UAMH 11346]|uniref:Uncharacterized protein n=1 Tax=Ophiostoma piceae (strain UAMH 11346) TaxID=1262450 RepID=S3BUQ8_OPHP1|nr:hypothetical protein F503_00143 [Ophiostoma piceae UAMH 11346]